MADDDKEPKTEAKDALVLKKDAGDAIAATAAKPAKKPAPPPVDAEEDDDEYEDEEEEDDEPPPPPVKKASLAKGKVAARGKVAPKGKLVARGRAIRRLPVRHYLPWAGLGMALVGVYVLWYTWSYAVPAVLGIAISVWAYIGVGSANEIKS